MLEILSYIYFYYSTFLHFFLCLSCVRVRFFFLQTVRVEFKEFGTIISGSAVKYHSFSILLLLLLSFLALSNKFKDERQLFL